MPELPDLEYQVPILARELAGRRILGMRLVKPVVLRAATEGDPAVVLVGHAFRAVTRRGPFVWFQLEGRHNLEIVIHPMLAGRFTIAPVGSRGHGDLAVVWTLDDDRELRYRDDVEMGKVYVVERGAYRAVAGFDRIGVDVLDETAFTRDAFRALATKRRDQVKAFLLDHGALDTLGNAYSDEALWEAGIHPKARVKELSVEQLDRLHDAIVTVLTKARDEIVRRHPPLHEKVRDFLAVRGRKDQPCPRCGTRIRVCGMRGEDAYFCPKCQPDAKGRTFVDWSRLPR